MPDKPKSWETSEHKGRPRSKPDEWFSQLPPEEIKHDRTVKSLVTQAKKQNNWLYDPKDKRWYTPEEYLELKERIARGLDDELSRMEIKDPLEALTLAGELIKGDIDFEDKVKLKRIIKKFVDFGLKVAEYYRSK